VRDGGQPKSEGARHKTGTGKEVGDFRCPQKVPGTFTLSSHFYRRKANMKQITLLIICLFLVPSFSYCQELPKNKQIAIKFRDKERICEQQFNAVLNKIKKLSRKYPVLADFEKKVSLQKEYVEAEKGMYYGLYYTNNFQLSMLAPKAIDSSLPYAGISFFLRTGNYSGQSDVQPIGLWLRSKTTWGSGQYRFDSGIGLGGQVVSDNVFLNKELNDIFNNAILNILQWEKEKNNLVP
jgi:hypothetical protein